MAGGRKTASLLPVTGNSPGIGIFDCQLVATPRIVKSTFSSRPAVRQRRSRWDFFFRCLAWSLLGITLAGRLGAYFFLFELFSHFAVQAVAAGVGLLYFVRKDRAALGAAGVSLLIQGWQVVPWLTGNPAVASPVKGEGIRVLHANVLYANTAYPEILKSLEEEKADVLFVAEVTPAFFHAFHARFRATYPFQYMVYAKSRFHVLVGSRTPLKINHKSVTENRMLEATTVVRGREIALVSVHPKTPIEPSWFASRNRRLSGAFEAAAACKQPAVLAGDFNVSVFSPVYQALVGQSGLLACRKGFGLLPTYRNGYGPLMIPIDHVLTNDGFRTTSFRTKDIPGSDHKAVIADLQFR